jgi:hypothetical protein
MAYVALPSPKNISKAHKDLAEALAKRGFFLSQGVLADRYYEKGKPDSQSFFVYNRAINPDGTFNGKSNYNVCVLEGKRRLRVFFANPDESPQAANLGYNEYLSLYSFSGGNTINFAEKVAEAAYSMSLIKPENAYRIIIHNHLSRLSGAALNKAGSMYDDGCSPDGAFLQNALLANADFIALTSHNHFLPVLWRKFAQESAKYGVQLIAGFEATLPIFQHEPWLAGTEEGKRHNPNGPHIVLLFSDEQVAAEFWSRYFSGRTYSYAPCASSFVELSKIYDIIDGQYRKSIARLVAHPVCDVSLPDVGLANRVAKGEITVEEMGRIIMRSQGIALFNMTLGDSVLDFGLYHRQVDECGYFDAAEKERRHKNIEEARRYFTSLLEKHQLGRKLSPNNINMALAAEFGRITLPYTDTDSHNFDWAYTDLGFSLWMVRSMSLLWQGHNTLLLPSVPAKKPSSSDIVMFLIDNKSIEGAVWSAHVFFESKDGFVRIANKRKEATFAQKAFNWLEKMYYLATKQVPVLASDTISQATLHEPLIMLRSSIPNTIPK